MSDSPIIEWMLDAVACGVAVQLVGTLTLKSQGFVEECNWFAHTAKTLTVLLEIHLFGADTGRAFGVKNILISIQ